MAGCLSVCRLFCGSVLQSSNTWWHRFEKAKYNRRREKKIICIWKPGGLQKGQSIAITATGHGVFYRFCLPKNLVGYLSFFMNLMLLYTLYQIEMNLRKPGDVYRFVTAHIWANKRPPMKSCKVCEWERKRVKNAHSPENESLHQIFTMKRRLFI